MFVVWKQFTAALSGASVKTVRCEKCRGEYHYECVRRGQGQGTSLYYLNNRGAARRAEKAAAKALDKALARGIDPVPCPHCGWFQSDMVREVRKRTLAWMKILALAIGIVGVLAVFIAYTALSDGYEDPLTSEGQIILAAIATMAAVGVLAPLVLRGAMLSSRDPNVSFPNKPAPIPGMPRPFKRDASGAIIPAGPPPGAARSPDGWVTVQLLTMPLPPECSVCLKETDQVATFNKSDLVQVPLRICPDCYAAYKRTRASWIVGGIGALALPALVISMMLPEVDLAGQIISTVIAAVVGGIAGAIIGNGRGAPAKFGAFDSTLNTLRIRFRNPAYADVFLRQQEENDVAAATMSSSPQLAH